MNNFRGFLGQPSQGMQSGGGNKYGGASSGGGGTPNYDGGKAASLGGGPGRWGGPTIDDNQIQSIIRSAGGLAQAEPQLAQYGINLQRNGDGSAIRGRIFLPDGRAIDTGLNGEQYVAAPSWSSDGGNSNNYNDGGGGSTDPFRQFLMQAMGGYSDFSKDGGFSQQNIQDMRARAIAPTRAVYQNAQNEITRGRALQGGYSPNFNAAQAKMARQMSEQMSDASTNVNASLAQMIQQGRLAGLGGLAGNALGGSQQNLAAMNAMNSLYGTSPGLADSFGRQLTQGNGQMLNLGELFGNWGNSMIGGRLGMAKDPTGWQSFAENFGNIAGGIGNAAGGGAAFRNS